VREVGDEKGLGQVDLVHLLGNARQRFISN